MINEIKEVAQLGGQVVIVVLFLTYLYNKGKLDKQTFDRFDTMISNHLHTSSGIIKDNSKALNKVAVNLKELSIVIKNGRKVK